MLLLKIFYKAFYKTKNRKESTSAAFSAFLTYHIIFSSLYFLLIIPFKPVSYVKDIFILKAVYFIIIMSLAVSSFIFFFKLSKKTLNGDINLDVVYSVTKCRVLVSFHNYPKFFLKEKSRLSYSLHQLS